MFWGENFKSLRTDEPATLHSLVVRPSETKGPDRGPFPFSHGLYAADSVTDPWSIWRLSALLPLALLLLVPAAATAADTYVASWNGGHLTATANSDFTEATIESVSVSFENCGTGAGETSCIWEATAILHSDPETRCDPATPEDQVVWDSGLQTGNGSITDGPSSFALEGCRGQKLVMRVEFHKTYGGSGGPLFITRGATEWAMLVFGYHPVEEADKAIPTEYNPPEYEYPPLVPNFSPSGLSVASDCRSLTIGDVRYIFAFKRIGCWKAGILARKQYASRAAPSGYACRHRANATLCWRRGQPQKYLEWRLPGTPPAHV